MKPTEAQLGTLFRWFKWKMTSDKASKAMKWLENNATRSDEIKRVHDLYHSSKLDEDKCFETPIWQGFHYVEPLRPGGLQHGK